jgi:AcrR family transcriptional regulator
VTTLDTRATNTRERVIDATIECILDEGLYRASSNRIAKRAGVSWGVIQHHFGSREALLREAFQEGMSELIDLLDSAVITGDTFETRLGAFTDIIWTFYRQRRFVAYEQLTLNLVSDPTVDAATVRLVRRRQARIGELLTDLARQVVDDEIADVLPPAALLQIVRGLAIGLVLAEAAKGNRRAIASGAPAREREVLLAALAALVRDAATSRPEPSA